MAKRSTLPRRAPVLGVFLCGLLLVTGGCANTNNRDDDTRGASLLILDSMVGEDGEAFIFSDVCDTLTPSGQCGVFNDSASASFRNEALAPGNTIGVYQDIQLYRYQVSYTRSDGNNTQGIHVPFAFDAVMSSTVQAGGNLETGFVIVRHVAKTERPLVDLVGVIGEQHIDTNTRVDFWGRDVAGNEHHVFGWIHITFGDFAS